MVKRYRVEGRVLETSAFQCRTVAHLHLINLVDAKLHEGLHPSPHLPPRNQTFHEAKGNVGCQDSPSVSWDAIRGFQRL